MAVCRVGTAYSQQYYADLPDILESYQRLIFRQRLECIDNALRQLFLDYHVEDIFGVRLIHKHFPLNDDERMVQYGHTALPWDSKMAAARELDGTILPSSWLFRDGVAHPYEFHYVPDHQRTSSGQPLDVEDFAAFFTAYRHWLGQNNLIDVLGLFILQSEKRTNGWSEMLEINLESSRASVMFPQDAYGEDIPFNPFDVRDGEEVIVPAGWFFFKWDDPQVDGCRHAKPKCKHKCRHGKKKEIANFRERYKVALWVQ